MSGLRSYRNDVRGTSAVEFAMVLPVALLFLFGMIDVGRYAWALNKIEKAAQMGARFAVVTNVVPGGLSTADYVGNTACGTTLQAGGAICSAALGEISCSNASCTCRTDPCPAIGTYNAAAFANILHRVRVFAPFVTDTSMTVAYRGSGLGYAGDPGMDVAPLVTVRIRNQQFRPVLLSLFGGTVNFPDIERSLTLEDGLGTQAD